MSAPLLYYDFRIIQGADVPSVPFNWAFDPGSPGGDPTLYTYPFNFTGATILLQVRAEEDSASSEYLALSVGSGLTLTAAAVGGNTTTPTLPNGFSAAFTKAQTLTLPNDATLYYDAMVTMGGLQDCWVKGKIKVVTTVSR